MSVLSTKRPLHSLDDLSSPSAGGKRLRNSMAVHNFHKRESLLKDVDPAQIHVGGGASQFSQNVPPSPPQHRITAIPRTPRSPTSMAAALATAPTTRTPSSANTYRARTYSWDEVVKIVDAAVREREASLRREYETVVQEKLAEQFQTFTKFNNDYIHRQLRESQFDYMS